MDRESIPEPALLPLHDDGTIGAVRGRLTSGKEATLWCCEAGRALSGVDLVAVKVYRTSEDRSFRRHSDYLDTSRIPSRRVRKAIESRSRAGREMSFGMWIEREWESLVDLHAMGVAVPRPYRRTNQAIAMEYLGKAEEPAPLLKDVRLSPGLTRRAIGSLLEGVEAMLDTNRIHGDLSPYNVLWWKERPWIIDLPQIVDPRFQPNASWMLDRDVRRLTDWAATRGVVIDTDDVVRRLWRRWRLGEIG